MQCAYCLNLADSEDHIPPKSLYAGKATSYIARVPSCGDCRRKFDKEDEFFKILHAHAAGEGNPISKDLLFGSVARALENSPGLRKKFASQTVSFELLTKSGISTGKHARAIKMTDADWRRIQVVLIRFARALNYRLSGWKKRYDNHVYTIVDFESDDGRNLLANEEIMSPIRAAKAITIGHPDVCKIKVIALGTLENAHLWLFDFYGRKRFFLFTTPRERLQVIAKRNGSRSGIITF